MRKNRWGFQTGSLLCALVLGIGVEGGMGFGTAAQTPADHTITAYPTTSTPIIDGQISPGEYGDATPIEVDFLNPRDLPGVMLWSDIGPVSKEDMSFKVYAVYTSTDLYIAVDVTDDILVDDSPGEAWKDDNVEIFIDGDLVSNDLSLGWEHGNNEGSSSVLDIGGEGGWLSSAAAGEHVGGRIHEFLFPLKFIDTQDGSGTTPATSGSTIGFSVFVTDDDGDTEFPDMGAWVYKQDQQDKYLEDHWGRLHFEPSPPRVNDLSDAYNMGELTESRRKTKRVTLENEGGAPLEMALSLEGDGVFSLSREEITLDPGAKTQFTITFFPTVGGDFSSMLTIRSNDPSRPVTTVPITGKLLGSPPTTPEPLTAHPIQTAPVVDGRIEGGEYGDAVPVEVNFLVPGSSPGMVHYGEIPTEDDLSFTVYAAYTSTYLYIAVDVTDDAPLEDEENEYIILLFDGDLTNNDITQGREGQNNEGYSTYQALGGEMREVSQARIRAGGWVYEYRENLNGIDTQDGSGRTDAASGATIGFNIVIGDVDVSGSSGDGSQTNSKVRWISEKDRNGDLVDQLDEAYWGRLFFKPSPPEINDLSNTRISFGDVSTPEETTKRLFLQNTGESPLEVELSLIGDDVFRLAEEEAVIEPGSSDRISVFFSPGEKGDYSATLAVRSNDPEQGLFTIPVTGTMAGPQPEMNDLSSARIDFGEVPGTEEIEKSLFLRNTGEGTLEVALSLSGDDVFRLAEEEGVIEPGSSSRISVFFSPGGKGYYSATLTVRSNDPDQGLFSIPVGGEIIDPARLVTITTIAGNGEEGYSGDGGPATSASLASPNGVSSDYAGNIYIADTENGRIRKVDGQTGTITTAANLRSPEKVFVDDSGDIYVAGSGPIYRIDGRTGSIEMVAGGGSFHGDGSIAAAVHLKEAADVHVDASGNLFIAEWAGHQIRKVDGQTGIITTVAGNGENGFSGDGGPAIDAVLSHPQGIFVDGFGNLYIADTNNNRVRKVDGQTGIITTVAGNSGESFNGDGVPAIEATLTGPEDIFLAGTGVFYVSDFADNQILEVERIGDLYIADTFHHRLRKVDGQTGIITTVAGSGNRNFSGDGGLAMDADLSMPSSVHVDFLGSVHIADTENNRIRKIVPDQPAGVSDEGGVELSQKEIGFADLLVGEDEAKTFTFTNRNSAPIELVLSLEGDGAFRSSVEELSLAPGTRERVELTFAPPAAGEYAATLKIAPADAGDEWVTVPLTGKGSEPPRIEISRSEIRFSDLLAGNQGTETITFSNEGGLALEATFHLEGDSGFSLSIGGTVLASDASRKVEVTFAPSAAGEYATTLRVESNDPEKGEVTIPLSGNSIALPDSWDPAFWQWTLVAPGDEGDIRALAEGRMVIDPEDSQRIYASGSRGFTWSEDGGQTWQDIGVGLSINELVATLVDGEVTLFIRNYTGEIQDSHYVVDGLYRSTDRGQTWERIASFDGTGGTGGVKVTDIAVDVIDSTRLYAGTLNGLFVTEDSGETWMQIDSNHIQDLAVAGGKIYCRRGEVLFRSDNRGRTWQRLHEWTNYLAVNPTNPDVVYRSTSIGQTDNYLLFRSTDGGANWGLVLSNPTDSIGPLYFDPADPTTAYVVVGSDLLKRDFDDPAYESPEEETLVSRDPRRTDFWKFHRTANLGPKAGNLVGASELVVDRQRNRGLVFGGTGFDNAIWAAVVDFQLNAVTTLVSTEAMGIDWEGLREIGIGAVIHEDRDELYLMGEDEFLQVVDLNTLTLKKKINLGSDARPTWMKHIYYPDITFPLSRILRVDEREDRLYLVDRMVLQYYSESVTREKVSVNVFVVDLASEEVVAQILVDAPMDMALDPGGQALYLANEQNRTIDILNPGDARIRDTIQLELVPYALQADPQEPYLYAFVKEPILERRTDYGRLLRIDLRTNAVDREITDIFPDGPSMVVDAATRTLWLSGISGGGGARYKVDLEDFRLLFSRDLYFFFPSVSGITPEGGDVLEMGGGLLNLLNPADGRVKMRIGLRADPQGISVSEVHNQVYIPRGSYGGFFILDEVGDLINTIGGGRNRIFGGVDPLVVDELADRLFVAERIEERDEAAYNVLNQIAVYELSTLRLVNRTAVWGDDPTAMRPDHERGVLWVMVNSTTDSDLHKLDLLSGELLERRRLNVGLNKMELVPSANKAYATYHLFSGETGRKGKVTILNLENQTVAGTIDLEPHLKADHTDNLSLSLLGIDPLRNRLYVSALENDKRVAVIDTEQDKVIELLELPGFNTWIAYSFDVETNTVIHPDGRIVNLETLEEQDFAAGESGWSSSMAARNRATNTIYTLNNVTADLVISLGPAGTEVPPPPIPEEVTAEAGDEEVVVSWSPVDDPNLIGYHVYRSDRAGSNFTRITHLPLRGVTFTDLDLTNGQTYTYQLSSVGKPALESIERTEPVSATPTGGGNFHLLVLRKSVSVAREDSVSLPMSVEILEDFDEEVTLSVQTPEGIEVVIDPAQFVPPRIVEVKVRATEDAPLGRFELVLQGESIDKVNTAGLVVEVTAKVLEQSVLTLELDQEEVPLDIPLLLNGRLFPGTQTQVRLDFEAERADTLITLTVDTDKEGGYRARFLAPFTDKWNVSASWAGNDDFEGTQSRTVEFRVTSGKTRITATSDLADDADLGWIATVKGRIYPSPGTVGVTLNVRRPDGTEEKIEGVLSSPEGFYGHDLRMDQQGLWEIWASWKGNNRLLGAASSVITVPVAADVGRVLLMACGQDSPRDIFWPTSNYLANLAYKTFQKRRLLKEKILYLNDRQDQDVDRDGFMEDVDGGATMGAMSDAWTWANERVNVDNPLYVYLVGKGTPMGLEVAPGEVLTARQLGEWLDEVESSTGAQATLIVEAAHAGNFIRDLSQQGRHVIASTGPGLAYYQAEGYMSFSQYFFTDLYQGKSLQEAFLHTHNILRNLPGGFRDQRPGLEAEGNVIANQPGDYLRTMDAFIGAPFELGDLSPQIKASSLSSVAGGAGKRVVTQTAPISEDGFGPRLKLAKPVAAQGVEISARIDDAEGNLKVVRAMIIPPESDSLSSLTKYPEVELADEDGDGTWVGVSHEFLEEGVYPVILYAIDGAGNAAEPLRTTVLVEPPPPLPTGDFNGDGLVDFADFFMFADAFGGDDPGYDLDGSGLVDFGDFFLFADAFGGPLGKLLALAEEMLHLPTEYALWAPYPNPFNSEVVVKYSLPQEGDVELVVYNMLGQVVRRLATGHQGMGHHQVVWDGRDDAGRGLATGTYLVQLRAEGWCSDASRLADLRFTQVRKVAFVK